MRRRHHNPLGETNGEPNVDMSGYIDDAAEELGADATAEEIQDRALELYVDAWDEAEDRA